VVYCAIEGVEALAEIWDGGTISEKKRNTENHPEMFQEEKRATRNLP
jgi:hypothetical protein